MTLTLATEQPARQQGNAYSKSQGGKGLRNQGAMLQ